MLYLLTFLRYSTSWKPPRNRTSPGFNPKHWQLLLSCSSCEQRFHSLAKSSRNLSLDSFKKPRETNSPNCIASIDTLWYCFFLLPLSFFLPICGTNGRALSFHKRVISSWPENSKHPEKQEATCCKIRVEFVHRQLEVIWSQSIPGAIPCRACVVLSKKNLGKTREAALVPPWVLC